MGLHVCNYIQLLNTCYDKTSNIAIYIRVCMFKDLVLFFMLQKIDLVFQIFNYIFA